MRHGRPHEWLTPRKGDRVLLCGRCSWTLAIPSELTPAMHEMIKADVHELRGEDGYLEFREALIAVEGKTA